MNETEHWYKDGYGLINDRREFSCDTPAFDFHYQAVFTMGAIFGGLLDLPPTTEFACPECGTSGEVELRGKFIPISEYVRCPVCNGDGYLDVSYLRTMLTLDQFANALIFLKEVEPEGG